MSFKDFMNEMPINDEDFIDDVKKDYMKLMSSLRLAKRFYENDSERVKDLKSLVHIFERYEKHINGLK